MTTLAPPHLVGGHVALDLVNSVERGVPVPGRSQVDWLPDWEATVRWAVHAGALDEVEAAASLAPSARRQSEAYGGVLALREAAHLLLLSCRGDRNWTDPEVRAALALVQQRWHESVARTALVPEGRGLTTVGSAEPLLVVLDRLADAVVGLLTGPGLERLKACPVEAGGCGWLFLDQTRNGSRRWCRMEDCGTRVKTDRLTARRRADRRDDSPRSPGEETPR